ncbi:MAG: phytanoyl-CoA dioxygenase family protein [Anaerolineaceae bacterium]|nr:phytanoyl-CoA dioxygenase family protein [Anaerolineaceae bacterium]
MKVSQANLPEISTEYALSKEDIASYQRAGHIVLRSVLSAAEVSAYEPYIAAAVQNFTTEFRPLAERDTYAKAFLQIMNLWQRDEAVRRYVLAQRFANIAADLMGVDAVRLYHDQALFKEPGGGITPWHQDEYYWPLDTDHTITMWMPLVDVTPEMGTLLFASGSHHEGYLGDLPISDKSDETFRQFVAQRGYTISPAPTMAAGDASFHSGWTLHTAPGNATGVMREVMTVIYFADGARLTIPDHQNRANDLANWFPGLKPGDLAASPLNPQVSSR